MSTFDIIILVLLALAGIIGFQKGLITGVSKFIGKIAAIFIAYAFHQQFLSLLEKVVGIREMITPKVGELLLKMVEGKIAGGGYGNSNALIQPVAAQATKVLTDYVLNIGSILILFILASLIINLIIAMVITPLARNLSLVNRGGGLAFGVLSSGVVLCLILGLITPFLTTTSPSVLKLNDSFLYPWMIQGYDAVMPVISGFSGDILTNPLESIPIFKETSL